MSPNEKALVEIATEALLAARFLRHKNDQDSPTERAVDREIYENRILRIGRLLVPLYPPSAVLNPAASDGRGET